MVLVRNLCVPVVPVHLDLCTDRQYVMYVVYYVMYLNMMHVHPRYWYIGTPASFCCAAVYHTCVHIFIYLFMYKYCIACCLASRQRRGKLHYSLPLKEANFAENSAPAAGLAKIQGMPQKHMQPMIE